MDFSLVNTLNLLTFAWLGYWVFRAFKDLVNGHYYTIYIVILIHFLFSGVPLLLDVLFRLPDFIIYPGFNRALHDQLTSIIYCLYVSIIPPILWRFGRPKINAKDRTFLYLRDNLLKQNKSTRLLLIMIAYILLFSPVIAWLLSPDPSIYFKYAELVKNGYKYSEDIVRYNHIYIRLTTITSILGACALIFLQLKKINKLSFKVSFWLVIILGVSISGWLHGKRTYIAIGLVLILLSLVIKKVVSGKQLVIAFLVGLPLLFFVADVYQSNVRGLSRETIGEERYYDQFRLYLGKDHQIKLAIYSELYPEKNQILEYRLQTFYYYAISHTIPRLLWPGKPKIAPSYEYFLSKAALGQEIDSDYSSPGIYLQASYFGEMLSNVGWLGILLGPITVAWFCRVGDSSGKYLLRIWTMQIVIFALYLGLREPIVTIIWVFWVLRNRYLVRKQKRKLYQLFGKLNSTLPRE
jgi:hypothetical protein